MNERRACGQYLGARTSNQRVLILLAKHVEKREDPTDTRSDRTLRGSKAFVALALVLVFLISTPAYATVWDFGTKDCGANIVGIRSYSSGLTQHWVTDPSFYGTGWWWHGAAWHVRTSITSHTDVDWLVEVDNGGISDPGTYAYCTQIQ